MLGATDKVQGTGNGNDKLLDPPSKFFSDAKFSNQMVQRMR